MKDEELEDKASGDKFDWLLMFLKKAKKRVQKKTWNMNVWGKRERKNRYERKG